MTDTLREDTPLESPENDRLGYAHFASQLAETIAHRTPSNGYTIGVNGPWGSGKSTILHFVEEYLKKTNPETVVVRFNPWWFSGEADLLDKFLSELAVALETKGDFSDIRTKLAKLSSGLSKVPFETVTGVPTGWLFSTTATLLHAEEEGIEEVKQAVVDELSDADQNIVVMIDDIDRLSPKRITQMFQIVKTIADFPNVVYLLAFDQTVVSESIEDEANIREGGGIEYIEKIIQLPLQIPVHQEGTLESLFVDELTKIPGDFTVQEDRWETLLRSGVLPILETPRDVLRLSNTIDVMYTAVGEEVNFTDLVGLEALRVFHKEVYDEISATGERFVGFRLTSSRFNDKEADDYSDVFNLVDEDDKEAVESILRLLFPFVRDNLLDQTSAQQWDKMRVEKRICHEERFPVYFSLSIPEGELSSPELGAIISRIGDSEQLTEKLESLLEEKGTGGLTKASVFFRRLDERLDRVGESDVEPLLQSIFLVGDEILKKTPLRSRNREARKISALVESILKLQPKSERLGTLTSAISNGQSPALSTYVLRTLYRDHGRYDAEPMPEDETLFDSEEMTELQSTVVDVLRETARRNELIDNPYLQWALEFWAECDESDEVDEWVDRTVESQEGLLLFIDGMSATTVVGWETTVQFVDPRWLSEYMELDNLEARISSIEATKLSENERDIVDRFKSGMKMLDQGKDPSSPESWVFG